MAWVVDTSVILDIVTGDPFFEPRSSACLQTHLPDGLVISPITFIGLAPSFRGDEIAAERFLQNARIMSTELWQGVDTIAAFQLWEQFQTRRRLGTGEPKRPLADVRIAAFASRFQGIITRNASDFQGILPTLPIVVP